jgi:hypothetical protein
MAWPAVWRSCYGSGQRGAGVSKLDPSGFVSPSVVAERDCLAHQIGELVRTTA